jgi:hypothetical protein
MYIEIDLRGKLDSYFEFTIAPDTTLYRYPITNKS